MSGWAIRVPASSANLGAGFDVLGMALSLYADVGVLAEGGDADTDRVPAGGRTVDEHHPAAVAFRQLGGEGRVWVRTSIPIARGLGFSGAVRVGGAAAALVTREGVGALDAGDGRATILAATAALERHADNAAASIYGGVVVATVDPVTVNRVPLAFDPAVVVWVPAGTTTSTDRSRGVLSDEVSRRDAVFNLGRVAAFVAACANGDRDALRTATEDRLHQPSRLAGVPASAAALAAALDAGAWAAWLSGSGPTVAAWCGSADAERIAAALPPDGRAKVLRIDHAGAVVTQHDDAAG